MEKNYEKQEVQEGLRTHWVEQAPSEPGTVPIVPIGRFGMRIALDEGASEPIMGTKGAAGYDLMALTKDISYNRGQVTYDTGVHFEIPFGFVGLVFPRSSVATKTDLSLANCVGVIDSDYRGSVKVVFDLVNRSLGRVRDTYDIGERCCQIVFVPYLFVEQFDVVSLGELTKTERGAGGYGSTGK